MAPISMHGFGYVVRWETKMHRVVFGRFVDNTEDSKNLAVGSAPREGNCKGLWPWRRKKHVNLHEVPVYPGYL